MTTDKECLFCVNSILLRSRWCLASTNKRDAEAQRTLSPLMRSQHDLCSLWERDPRARAGNSRCSLTQRVTWKWGESANLIWAAPTGLFVEKSVAVSGKVRQRMFVYKWGGGERERAFGPRMLCNVFTNLECQVKNSGKADYSLGWLINSCAARRHSQCLRIYSSISFVKEKLSAN